MRNPTRLIPALGAVFFASIALAACGGSGIPSDAVVKVGDQAITKNTFTHWLTVASASSSQTATGSAAKPVVPDPPSFTACIAHLQAVAPKPAKGQAKPTAAALKSQCEQQYTALKQQVLGFLISSNWVIGEASSLGVKVTDKEVEKQFETIKKQQFPKAGEFQKFLNNSGQTVSDLLLRVKLNMLSQKIQKKVSSGKGKPVTQAQITKYYNENKQRFGQAEKRDIELILTKTQAQAEKAKSEVSSGKAFASVAKSSSIDPVSKAKGGLLAGVVRGQEEKALDTAIFAAKKGVLSGPIKTPFGYYVFKVKETHAASQQTQAQVQSSIKQQLTAQQQQAALSTFVKGFQKKWTAKTDCRSEFVVQDCKQYKAPKTPATTTPATPAAPQTSTTITAPAPKTVTGTVAPPAKK